MARMDPVGYDTGRYLSGLADQEAAGMEACVMAALKDGHTQEQAENCDDGELKCSACPWAN